MLQDQSPRHRKRCRRENEPGHAHFLTFSCFQRRPFLSRDRSRRWMLEAIEKARVQHHFDLWAWVIMPEHVHLVLFPRALRYSMSAILSTLKQPVAKRAALFVKDHAPAFARHMMHAKPDRQTSLRFWQRGGGYDRNLYTPAEAWEKINYVHQNPVRRGLVAVAEDWRWSSAVDYSGAGTGPLHIDIESLTEGNMPTQAWAWHP